MNPSLFNNIDNHTPRHTPTLIDINLHTPLRNIILVILTYHLFQYNTQFITWSNNPSIYLSGMLNGISQYN